MLRNQSAIKKQLRKYLDIQLNDDSYLKLLTKEGYCYSFSVCRAAMRRTGKLLWWKAALAEIAAWDGRRSSLEKKVKLPDADNNDPVPLKTIFERVIHYIVFNHAASNKYPPAHLNQTDFLSPGNLFLVLQGDNPLQISSSYKIAGHFTRQLLVMSLQDPITQSMIQNNICLAHSFTHTCELSYDNNIWYFYNPNYEDGEAKAFTSLEQLVDELMLVLKQDISIELACFDTNLFKSQTPVYPFSYYHDELLFNHPEYLVQGKGLQAVAYHPDLMPALLDQLQRTNQLEGLNLDAPGPHGCTSLIVVARHGHLEAITALCKAGANPNIANDSGWTPLMAAARKDHAQAITLLCQAGANPNQSHSDGRTPLMVATLAGHTASVNALCNAGALPVSGDTSLLLAAQHGHTEIMNILLHRQVDFTITTSIAMADLLKHANTQNRHHEVMAYFKSRHCDWWIPNTLLECTALHLAVFFGHAKIVTMLLNKMNLQEDTLIELSKAAKVLNYSEIDYSLQLCIKERHIREKLIFQKAQLGLFGDREKNLKRKTNDDVIDNMGNKRQKTQAKAQEQQECNQTTRMTLD